MRFESLVGSLPSLLAQGDGWGQTGPNWARISQILRRGSQGNADVNKLYCAGMIPGQRLTRRKPGIASLGLGTCLLQPPPCSSCPLHPPLPSLGGTGGWGVPMMVLTGEVLA